MLMKRTIVILVLAGLSAAVLQGKEKRNSHYITNRKPLIAQPYTALPPGAIKPEGMLLRMLEMQRDGMTGCLDSVYAVVCGDNNGWLGGTGDGWERGPYWLDGLVPLAYILDDDHLKVKAQRWIEWSIANQRKDGFFGPKPLPEGTPKIPGTQQGMREDWWPRMVMLKVLQQYYMATGDQRIITLMDRYFRYQLKTLPEKPLGNWTFWANRRGADNLQVVYWFYNITGEKYLLDLAEIIHHQTYDWTTVYSDNRIRNLNPPPDLHCVNVAQGLKAPVVYWQQHPEERYLNAPKQGLAALRGVHGFVTGMYGADEALHGNNPTQGAELCSAVEMMFSFESMLPVTGDVYYADYLEKIAYNVLPTQHTDDFMRRQYFQQVNQVLITDVHRNFFNDGKARICYGVKTGYPCCTCNMHQGWPKFVQNLWYATADNGLAALVYGPCSVTAKVAGGRPVTFQEETDYPFSETVTFTCRSNAAVSFPFHLRIPAWCDSAFVTLNGRTEKTPKAGTVAVLDRVWRKGDTVTLHLPMTIRFSRWYEQSLGIEHGPLVYALKIEEEWQEVKTDHWDHTFFEVMPASAWNYGIQEKKIDAADFTVIRSGQVDDMPWNLENAPVSIITTGRRIPWWRIVNGSAGPLPVSSYPHRDTGMPVERITLIPYGCTTLRIAEFPVIDKYMK